MKITRRSFLKAAGLTAAAAAASGGTTGAQTCVVGSGAVGGTELAGGATASGERGCVASPQVTPFHHRRAGAPDGSGYQPGWGRSGSVTRRN